MTRLNHLARTVPPSLFSSAAGIHDMLTHQAFCAITGLDSLSDSHWQQAILPVKYGGLGLRSAAEISNAAYIAGWAQSTSVLPTVKHILIIWSRISRVITRSVFIFTLWRRNSYIQYSHKTSSKVYQ